MFQIKKKLKKNSISSLFKKFPHPDGSPVILNNEGFHCICCGNAGLGDPASSLVKD